MEKKRYLLRNTYCFEQEDPEYYGWAGDDFISALIVAESGKEAMEILLKELLKEEIFQNYDSDELGERLRKEFTEEFYSKWRVRELGTPQERGFEMLVYGSY